jgi:uncharacterized protein with FMN-binding domain
MQDKLGIEIQKDDTVIYAKGAKQDDYLYIATVIECGSTTSVRILTHDTNRKLFRRHTDLVNITGLKLSNPEAFI